MVFVEPCRPLATPCHHATMMDLLLFWVVKIAMPRASGGVAGGTIFGDGSAPGGGPWRFASAGT